MWRFIKIAMARYNPNTLRTCEHCNERIVSPTGSANSKILIIGSGEGIPTEEDISSGTPFSGDYMYVLYNALGKHGLDMMQMRRTTLYLHSKKGFVERGKAKQSHIDWHVQQAIQECIGREYILLLGSDATKLFLKHTCEEISGLWMKSDILSAPYVMGTLNPLSILNKTIGEFTLAIDKFAALYKENIHD
jgi:hypothetical protein